jgi:16S rRNA (guanine527-N7)-methyltransferase
MDETKYFPDLTDIQKEQFVKLIFCTMIGMKKSMLFLEKILTLCIPNIYYSLGIAKIINFEPGTYVLEEQAVDLVFHWQFFPKRFIY